jgi:hypothetical protein
MEIKPPYTDDTVLTFGDFAFTRLSRVPAEYLLDYLKKKKRKYKPDQELIQYIKNNLEKIKARKDKPPPDIEIGYRLQGKHTVLVCKDTNKVIFISEKDAKTEIQRVQKLKQRHKKPVRAYACEKCGGWHNTSIPHEDWKK